MKWLYVCASSPCEAALCRMAAEAEPEDSGLSHGERGTLPTTGSAFVKCAPQRHALRRRTRHEEVSSGSSAACLRRRHLWHAYRTAPGCKAGTQRAWLVVPRTRTVARLPLDAPTKTLNMSGRRLYLPKREPLVGRDSDTTTEVPPQNDDPLPLEGPPRTLGVTCGA